MVSYTQRKEKLIKLCFLVIAPNSGMISVESNELKLTPIFLKSNNLTCHSKY